MKEAKIVINGQTLTVAQSMALRVAMGMTLFECGDDEMGRKMQAGYLDRAGEVLKLIHSAIKNGDTVGGE